MNSCEWLSYENYDSLGAHCCPHFGGARSARWHIVVCLEHLPGAWDTHCGSVTFSSLKATKDLLLGVHTRICEGV